MALAAVTIRKLPDEVLRAIRIRAAEHGRSTEAEIRDILQKAVLSSPKTGVGTEMHEWAMRELGGIDLNIERDRTPWRGVEFE